MSIAVHDLRETRPMSITGMVKRIQMKQDIFPRHRNVPQDELRTEVITESPTEIVTQVVFGEGNDWRPNKGIRRAKHRSQLLEVGIVLDRADNVARHISMAAPYRAPKSLFELVNS